MKLSIYNAKGTLLYEMPNIFEGCIEKVTLMSEDYIQLKFALAEPVFFPIGAWTEWNGKKYIVTELQSPTYNENTGGYEYELKLDAYYMAWKLRIYKYKNDADSLNNKEASFSLTAKLEEHIKCFLRCLKVEGFKFNDNTDYTYTIANDTELQEVKTLTYSSVNYINALNQMTEEWDTEWWVTENVLHFGKCQDAKETNVDFVLGKNVVNMSGSKSETNYATRVYAFGSTRNISANWNKGDAEFKVVSVDSKNKTFKFDKELLLVYFNGTDKKETFDATQISFIEKTKYFNVASSGGSGNPYGNDNEIRNHTPIEICSKHFTLQEGEYKLGDKLYAGVTDDASTKFTICLKCDINSYKNTPSISGASYFIRLYEKNSAGTYNASILKRGNISIDKNGTYQNAAIEIPLTDITITKENEYYIGIELTPTFDIPYKGNVTLSEGTKLLIRTSEKYYNVTTALKKVDSESVNNATFFTKAGTFYLKWNDTTLSLPTVGDVFHINNLITSKIPSWWLKANQQDADVIKAMTETHLPLPSPGYIDMEEAVDGEVVEKVLVFDDIYPRTNSAITEVRTKQQNVMDDSGTNATGETYTEYYIKQNNFAFSLDYQLQNGENMKVIFQSGALAGLEFEVEFDSSETPQEAEGFTTDHQFFRILRQQFDGGLMLPNGAMRPKVGDGFVLTGWDVSRVDDMCIQYAQTELKAETLKELKKMAIDPTTYECTLFSDIAYGLNETTYLTDDEGNSIVDENNLQLITDDSEKGFNTDNAWDFTLGRFVTLYNAALFKNGKRESRVMGYEKKMDIPWDSPVYTIGDKATYSRLGDMQKQIDGSGTALNVKALQYIGQSSGGSSGGASVYLIKRQDETQPSDTNTFSALRARQEFLHKQNDNIAYGQMNVRGGFASRSAYDGATTAADGIIEYYN